MSEDDDQSLRRTSLEERPLPVAQRARSRFVAPLAATVLGTGVVAFGWTHPTQRSNVDANRSAPDVPYLDGVSIRYSEGFAKRAAIEFGDVQPASLSPLVTVTGSVTFDPERVAAVGARIVGRVRAVRKLEGASVKIGDVLAELESAQLGEAQAALISARAHAVAANANETREKALAQAHIASGREAELAVASAASARADLLAAEQRVFAYGGRTGGETGILKLTSPIAGRVVACKVARGQSVEPTYTAFRVADLSRVWVLLAVFERELAAVHEGDAVEITAQSAGQEVLRGKVGYVGDVLDLETRTAPVRVVVDQPATPLRPGQSVVAKIRTAIVGTKVLVLPREAVTSIDGQSTVFVARDGSSVEPRMVKLGHRDSKQVEILSGLRREDRVATRGVFALKSEIYR